MPSLRDTSASTASAASGASGEARSSHVGDGVRRERLQDHLGRHTTTDQGVRQLSSLAGLALPQRDDEQDGLARHVVGEVLEDGQGLRVCPLQVVDHQRGRALARERYQQAEDGLPQHQPGLRGGDGGFAPLGHERRQRRNERRQVPARADAQPGRAEQRFPDRAQRRPAGGRPADQHRPSLPHRPGAELADQPALADAGRPAHDAHRSAATPRFAQPIDLAVPTHQLTSEQRSGRAHVHHTPTLPHDLGRARTPRTTWPAWPWRSWTLRTRTAL